MGRCGAAVGDSRSMVGVLRQELRESKEVQAERLKAERARREKAGRA